MVATTSLPSSTLRSCLVGGAIGDALGRPLEHLTLTEIRNQYGPEGLQNVSPMTITDDTQMTLFSFEGLLEAEKDEEMVSVYRAYRRWLTTQEQAEPSPEASGLAAQSWLYERRGPGKACLTGLQQVGADKVVNLDSKGCGAVMRAAPFGLFDYSLDEAFLLAAKAARYTHGHPTAAVSAGVFARLISLVSHGHSFSDAVRETLRLLTYDIPRAGETRTAVREAVKASRQYPATPETVELLGSGWVAEEALSIAVYCVLATDNAADALHLAINHSGDSDSVGSICGNLLGASGAELPAQWVAAVEGRDTIDQLVSAVPASASR